MQKAVKTPTETSSILEDSERRDAERSEAARSAEASRIERPAVADPEVLEKPQRRRFTTEFKLKVVREAEACKGAGEVGALLRRHGLYSSHLSVWRRERDLGAHERLSKKRGRRPADRNPLAGKLAHLERENRRLQRRLLKAELIIDIQKKASALLGIPLNTLESGDDE